MTFNEAQSPVTSHASRRWATAGEIALATISRPTGIVSVVLILCLVLVELRVPAARRLFASYPVSTSVVTTFIILIFTANIIDQIVVKRQQKRWELIRGIGMQGLNSELRVARDLLYILEHGSAPFDATQPITVAAEKAVEKHLPAIVREMMVHRGANDHGPTLIEMLVVEEKWVRFARTGLSEVSVYLRESLARWSPLLSIGAEVNDASHSMLLYSAYLVDAISVLELPLASERLQKQAQVLPAPTVKPFVKLWYIVAAAFVFVEEMSSNAIRPILEEPVRKGEFWESAMRNRITSSSCGYLKRWEKGDEESVERFHQDLRQARRNLKELQKNLIDIDGPGSCCREDGGVHP